MENNDQKMEQSAESVVEKVVILGSGPAGWSAALYTARAELNPLLLTGLEYGGQAAITNMIENYPGFPEGIVGSDLGEILQKQAEKFGARVEMEAAVSVDLSARPFTVKTYGRAIKTDSLIVCTGASAVHLNIPGEEKLTGRGVSYCATCDGWFFKEKNVVVVGGGDSALEEAIFLTRYAKSVTIVHRRDTLRAGAILQKRVKDYPKIQYIWNSIVTEILGEEGVTGVRIKNVKTGEMTDHAADGVFVFIGHHPNTDLFKGQVDMTPDGYLVLDGKMQTSVEGVFAAGEAADSVYRQVVTSAGMGAAAGIQAVKYLEEQEK
jgi:thioredoxin reductase (NADPH)